MQNLAILTVSIFVLIISYRLFRRAAGSMSLLKLNTVSYVFYFQIITSAVVGSVLLALGKLDYHPYSKPLSEHVKIEAWMWVMYSLLAMPLAMLIVNYFAKVKPIVDFPKFIKAKVRLYHPDLFLNFVLLGMLVFSVFAVLYLIKYSVASPIFTLLKGDASLAAMQRVMVRHQFNGIEHIRSFATYMLVPVFSYVFFAVAYLKKQWGYYVLYAIQLTLTLFVLIFDLQKAPLAFYLLGYIILLTLLRGGISRKQFLLFGVTPVILILIGYQLTTGQSALRLFYEWDSAFYGRIFLTGYFAFPLSLELFPDVITEPTYYSGIPTAILNYFGIENIESARRLMMYMNPEGVKKGTAHLFSGYYLGEAWANYGYAGLIISPFIVGAVVQAVHTYLLKHKKEVLLIAFYAYITTKWLLSAGVVSFIFLKIILYPYIIYLTVKKTIEMSRYLMLKTHAIKN